MLSQFRRSRFAAPLAFATLLSFVAPLLPVSRALADDAGFGGSASAMSPGIADGSMGLGGGASGGGDAVGSDGTARTGYPFQLPRAHGEAQPSLGLHYSSAAGVGFAGVGWSLDTPSIVRKGASGMPRFVDPPYWTSGSIPYPDPATDDFYVDGGLLLAVDGNPKLPPGVSESVQYSGTHPWVLYRREVDDGARYFFNGITWVEQTKSGHLIQYGTPLDGGSPSVERANGVTASLANGIINPDFGGGGTGNSIFRWNLVRDADASGNTVYYLWDDESELLGSNPRTAGTLYLTDIYDTAPTPTASTCTGGVTQGCGLCGFQTSTCANGVTSWSACTGQGVCTPGQTQTCSAIGTSATTATCTNTCQWGGCGTSSSCPGVCSAGQTQSCGSGGTQACNPSTCQWGPCTGQTCSGPSTQRCGNCGTQAGTCNNGVWVWGSCTGAGVCAAGSQQVCGSGGTQACDWTTCQWDNCTGQTCTGSSTQTCGDCGTQAGTCSNGSWVWGACTGQGCQPGSIQTCGGNGQQQCSGSCSWANCQCPQGYQLVGQTCEPITGSLIDDVLGVFEGTAYAANGPALNASLNGFAHHTHLTWSLPSYPAYPNAVTNSGGIAAPYTFSPIWAAPPFAQLETVDVFSATESATTRQLVREYQLTYTANATQTRSYLAAIQIVGDCDSAGGISEAGISAAAVASCAAKEAMPPTRFSYYGVPGQEATSTPAAPAILSEGPAYQAASAADFLVDLNGDAVADLVAGVNGMGGVEKCLGQWTTTGCNANIGTKLVFWATFGFMGSAQCPCPSGAPILGPSQTPGTPFLVSSENGLLTYAVDDSMWGFSVFADWEATGRASFLQLLPANMVNPLAGGGFTNTNPARVFLGQLSDPGSGTSLESLTASLTAADVNGIPAAVDATAPAASVGMAVGPSNAVDLDGDGLPDMALVRNGTSNWAMMTVRDHGGTTHPFQSIVPQHFVSAWENPTWAWNYSSADPAGGTFTAVSETTSGALPTTSTQVIGTVPAHAFADIDGDGLADEVAANKFRADWNDTMIQFFSGKHQGTVGWSDGPGVYLGLVYLPNRGDGRFGVPPQYAALDQIDPTMPPNADEGNYVTPGAMAPYGPYIVQHVGWSPPYPGEGPLPPPQSDSLSPTDTPMGYTMQSSAIRFGDLNGDGMSDYAVLDGSGLHICVRYGGWTESAHWRCTTDPSLVGNDQSDNTSPHATIMIGDVNGSGINRVIYFPAPTAVFGAPAGPATSISVSPDGTSGEPKDGLLSSISNGQGGVTTYEYASVNGLGVGTMPVPAWVVTAATTTNSLMGAQAVVRRAEYNYEQPLYDARDQTFVGFRLVTTTTSSDPTGNSPGLVTTTTYATQTDATCSLAACAGAPRSMIHVSRGLPLLTQTSENSASGRLFDATYDVYDLQQPYVSLDGRPGVSVASRQTVTYPSGPSATWLASAPFPMLTLGAYSASVVTSLPSTTPKPIVHETAYDIVGNPVRSTDFGVSGVDAPIVTTSSWALPPGDTTGWSYRAMSRVVGAGTPSGTSVDTTQPTREMDFQYDSLGRLTQVSAPLSGGVPLPGPAGGAGGARAAGQPPGALFTSPAVILETVHYDTSGNVTKVGNQDNPCLRTFTYDPLFDQLPVSATTFPDGCQSAGIQGSMTMDRRLDAVLSTLDGAGRLTVVKRDDFGRPTEVDRPSIATPGATTKVMTASYVDQGPIRTATILTGYGPDTGGSTAGGWVTHVRYIDGLGETRAVIDQIDPTTHGGQTWVLSGVHTSFWNGRTAAVYAPAFTSAPVPAGTLPAQALAPSGPSAAASYDGLGRPTATTDFNGNRSIKTYRDGALAVDTQDAEQVAGSHQGAMTTVILDGHGRVSTTDAHWAEGPGVSGGGDLVTSATYLPTGEPKTIVQSFPGGTLSRSLAYDSLGRVVQNTEPNSGTWTYAHDAEGRLVGTSDARGCGSNILYDLGGRPLAADYSPCQDDQPAYTPAKITGAFPYAGAEESYQYDATGQLVAVADRGRLDSYSYDAGGHLHQVRRQLSIPGGAVPYGAVHTKTVTQYTVTGQIAAWQQSAAAAPSQTVGETRSYGLDDSLFQVTADPSGLLVYGLSYDASGRTLTATFGTSAAPTGMSAPSMVAGYDNDGQLTTFLLGRAAGAATPPAGYTPPPAGDASLVTALTNLTVVHDMVGNPTSVTDSFGAGWPGGAGAVNQSYTYSDDYRLRSATSAPSSGLTSDPWVNPYLHEQASGSGLYPQLSSPSTGARMQNLAVAYDWRGNPVASTDDAGDFFDRSLGTVTTVPGTDQIAAATSSTGASLAARYDAAGNLVQVTTTGPSPATYTYSWDELGHLASALRVDDAGTVNEGFTYTSSGERTHVRRVVNGGSPTYTVSVFDSLLLKDAKLGADFEDDASTEHVYFAGGLAHYFTDTTGKMPLSQAASAAGADAGAPSSPSPHGYTFLNLRDPRGSSAFVVDAATGELVERTAYMPYGGLDADYRNPRWQGAREDIKYTDHWDGSEVGLVYFGARYYSPQLGRFISPDPLTVHALASDPNPYEFANGNPISNVDPTGLAGCPEDAPSCGSQGDPPPDLGQAFCDATGDCLDPTSSPTATSAPRSRVPVPDSTSSGWGPSMADFDNSPPEDPPPNLPQRDPPPGWEDVGAAAYTWIVANGSPEAVESGNMATQWVPAFDSLMGSLGLITPNGLARQAVNASTAQIAPPANTPAKANARILLTIGFSAVAMAATFGRGGEGAALEGGEAVLYRLITETDSEANFVSNAAKGLAPRGPEGTNPLLHGGLSMFDSLGGAAARAPILARYGRTVLGIAEIRIPGGATDVSVAKTLGPGHYTVTGAPSAIQGYWTFSWVGW